MRRMILGVLFSLFLATPAAAAPGPQASLEDLTLLIESGISDQTILVFLDTREIGFQLDSETIARLRQQGVSEEVIRYLLERTDAREYRDDRVVYVSAGPYPPGYYLPYYAYGVGSYFGAAILGHWTHGYHRVGRHLVGGHHRGHRGGHGGRSHLGSHRASHARAGHSGGRHRGGGHGGGHRGGGH